MNKKGYVYIISDDKNGPLYVGTTSNLIRKIWQHRQGKISGYCKKYKLARLVYFEACESIHRALWREHQIKTWERTWKLALIKEKNPDWLDLYREVESNSLAINTSQHRS